MPSSKCAAPGAILVVVALHERGDDRPAGEPRPLQLVQRLAPRQEHPDAGRPAEQLVERDRHEVRVPPRQVEAVRGGERGRVDEDVPAVLVGLLDPVERMVDAGEVRLRRIGEQVVVRAAELGEIAGQEALVDAQLGCGARHVGRLGAAGAGELAHAVHRVVVVEGEEEPVARAERVRLADEPQRSRRVRREDGDVLLRIRTEEPEHRVARPLDELRHRRRGRVDGVGVAEDARPQQLEMLRQLRLRVEPGARVVEVDVAGGVEPRVVGGAELVERRGGRVAGMLPPERLLRRVRCCERRHPLLSWPRLRPNARGIRVAADGGGRRAKHDEGRWRTRRSSRATRAIRS